MNIYYEYILSGFLVGIQNLVWFLVWLGIIIGVVMGFTLLVTIGVVEVIYLFSNREKDKGTVTEETLSPYKVERPKIY